MEAAEEVAKDDEPPQKMELEAALFGRGLVVTEALKDVAELWSLVLTLVMLVAMLLLEVETKAVVAHSHQALAVVAENHQ